MSRDWLAWHRQYDDPASSLSHRLAVVRGELARVLATAGDDVRLLSLCAGDGRDTVPVLAALPDGRRDRTHATLVELDPDLAAAAREEVRRRGLRVDVRTADAGSSATWRDEVPVDVLMLCGIFGNVGRADVRRTVEAVDVLLRPGGRTIWTRGRRTPGDHTEPTEDAAGWVRTLFLERGYDEEAYVHPADADFRVGVHRRPAVVMASPVPTRLFAFSS